MTLLYDPEDDSWFKDAACKHPDVNQDWFFPSRGEPVDRAVTICNQCPVKGPCGEWALVNNERHGIWGGMSERQRRAVRHQYPLRRICTECGNPFMQARPPGSYKEICSAECEHVREARQKREQKANNRLAMAAIQRCGCGRPVRKSGMLCSGCREDGAA